MSFAALVEAILAIVAAPTPPQPPPDEVTRMTPRQKAALVVVSGLPAPRGVGGVLVRRWNTAARRPGDTLVFVDQEGGAVRAFPALPPHPDAASFASRGEAGAAGRAAGRALRAAGVHVDLAPVLDAASGPLGPRHFRRPELGLAFARGLDAGGTTACPKHFPVWARLRSRRTTRHACAPGSSAESCARSAPRSAAAPAASWSAMPSTAASARAAR